jgi:hypothetical protein
MNYGKNQQALLDFLYKHPGKYHRIKGEKAIRAAQGLSKKLFGVVKTISVKGSKWFYVSLDLPQMLTVQN